MLLDNISSPERLPPTSDAFKQHLERRHYQTAVWGQARIQKPVLPNPEETDWTLADLLVPVFMTLDPIPKACLEMVSMLHWMGNLFAVNAESRMSCALGRVNTPIPTIIGESTCSKTHLRRLYRKQY